MRYTSIFVLTAIALTAILTLSCGSDDSNPVTNTTPTFTPKGMVQISAKGKSFQMGSLNGYDDEKPVHTVSFTYNFWMDTTEVTQKDYDSLMKITYASYQTPSWNLTYKVGDSYPAYLVSWAEAALYCNARSQRDSLDMVYSYDSIIGVPGAYCDLANVTIDYSKNGYRLPTEAEWEYGCRAGSTTDFYWGDDYDPYPSSTADTTEISGYAIWQANSLNSPDYDNDYGTHPVASKTANAYGLHDMAGNLYEWCNDGDSAYSSAAVTDPTGPGSDENDKRVKRGGGWGNSAIDLRSTNRTFTSAIYRYCEVGFRVVLPVK
jgi:sulfatase modifying factor 1